MTMRTAQEIFDTVSKHLLTQNKRSEGVHVILGLENHICAYRSVDGLKCAIGCLIPDEQYIPEMESLRIGGIVRKNWLSPELEQEFIQNINLISDLQIVHDFFTPEYWAEQLDRVRRQFNLSLI